MKTFLAISAAILVSGCASTPELPIIPEYHPANAAAHQAPMIQAFDVLEVLPANLPELPVPPGEELPPGDPEAMHGKAPESGKHQDHQSGQGHESTVPPPEAGMPDATTQEEGAHKAPPRPQDTLYKEPQEDHGHHEGTPMPPITVPSEQRGMGADSPEYHEHGHSGSNHVTHPDRSMENDLIEGKQVWKCPRHPEVEVETPGGRCPHCDTVLVPVRLRS